MGWSETSWQVDKETGDVVMELEASEDSPDGADDPSKSKWYDATVSKDHSDVKSWAMLNNGDQTYLVGSKKHMKDDAFPKEKQNLIVFKVTQKFKFNKDSDNKSRLRVRLTPQKPQKSLATSADFEKEDAVFWWPWAPYWGAWPGYAWAWPAYPFWSLEKQSDLEADETSFLEAGRGKGGIPAWSGYDPVPGWPWPKFTGWPFAGKAAAPAAEAAKKATPAAAAAWGVWPYGVWWDGKWYVPK